MRKIYLASSWRNPDQPRMVELLRKWGHEVYDFRNPPGATGFAWSEIDPDWLAWTPAAYIDVLTRHWRAEEGYRSDMDALKWCDTCVLLLPCGRSAHIEAGFAVGQGKRVIIHVSPDKFEPELMYLMAAGLVLTDQGLQDALAMPDTRLDEL